jgi:hypothetical protein
MMQIMRPRSRRLLPAILTAILLAAPGGLALSQEVKPVTDVPDVPDVPEEKPPKASRCLTEAEIREEVAAKRIIAQVVALRAARAAGGGEAVKARVCRGENGLVYAITSLKRDGKVLRIDIDAATGKLVERN